MEDLKAKAIARITAATEKLNRVWGKSIAVPKVEFVHGNDRVAGEAYYRSHKIVINTRFLTHDVFFDYSQGGETCEHEVAHLFTKVLFPNAKQAHGPEFRRVMNSLGLTGRTRHSMHLPDAKKKETFTYKCQCRTVELSKIRHNKMVRGVQKYICMDCRKDLVKV